MSDDLLALDGPLSPPMANGEVVFEAPWQGRVFGMARSLCEQGMYSWDDFREMLIQEIEVDDASRTPESAGYQYFDHFLAALVRLLRAKSLLEGEELAALEAALAARPHGHDHHH